MPESSSIAGFSLTDYLQQLTEQLAATHTQTAVLHTTLQPAIAALSALSGAILLLDPKTNCLQMAAQEGHDGQTIWQDGPLTPETPAGDALLQRQPLYFEHADTLKAAYPALETHTGAITVVATALLPLVLADRVLGVLILDFTQPHTFTPDERRFLTTLATQCSIALDRAQVITALQASETRFRRLVEVSPLAMGTGSIDGQLGLVNDAYLELIGQTRAAFDAGQIDWQAITPPEYQAQEAAAFETALQTGTSAPFQKELLTTEGERVPVEIMLVRYDEQQLAGYALDLRPQRAQEQRLREEGARLEQLVADRTAELLNEQAASRAFIAFSQQTTQTTDVVRLAEQAIEVLRTVLGNVSVAYYELRDDRWQIQRWSPDISPDFLAPIQVGFTKETPRFANAVAARQLLFVEAWDPALEQLPTSQGYASIATYPFFMHGQPYSVLSIGRREQQAWSEEDRAVVQAVGQALGQALERTETARQLEQQKAVAENRVRTLEAFEQLSRDLVRETDRYALIRRALEIMMPLLPPGFAIHYELEDGLWQVKVQIGEMGNAELQRLASAGWPFETPTVHIPWTTGKDFYQDQYDQGSDTPAEVVEQVNTSATLVVRLQGRLIGLIVFGLFESRLWTSVDRITLNTARQSLELALERAQNVAALAERTSELEQANQELQTSNQELEAFTYSASHDLRTPVRHVLGFAELAEKALDHPEKARRHLKIVKEASHRMTALIDAMLILSRAGRGELKRQPIPLEKLVAQAQRDVLLEFPDQVVEWQLGMLPIVLGDPETLQQVLTNLLSNAVKYGQGRDPLRVHLWAEERPGEIAVFVQDNGVGFDPQYAERLFGAFQRLHRQQDFAGTGIGLATVKRIVLRHGGRVWGEGRLGEGATFGFSLPREG